METDTVWIAESGEYEARYVVSVARTLADAVAAVKRIYGEPYIVQWEEKLEREQPTLLGHFEMVPGYSTQHVAVFEFFEHELSSAAAAPESASTEREP